MRQTLLFKLS